MESYRNMRVAVLGATGFIGSHLTERLVEEGAEVLAVAKTRARLDNLARVADRIHFAATDLASSPDASLFMDFQPRKIFHLAAHPDGSESFSHMRESLRQNTEMVVNVLEMAAAAKVDTIVFSDSSKTYGNTSAAYREASAADPVCSYAIAKAAAWNFCKLYAKMHPDSHVVALRPTMVYGPRQNVNLISYLIGALQRNTGSRITVQGGWQTRDPLHVSDAVEAFLRAGASPMARGHAIPVGGGEEMTVAEICRRVKVAFGSDAPIDFGASPLRITEIFRSSCDNQDAKRLLVWQPAISISEGLARLAGRTGQSAARSAVAGHLESGRV